VPDGHRNRATVVFVCRVVADPKCKMKSAIKRPATITSNILLGSSLPTNRGTAKDMLKMSWI